jgi:N-acetylglucosamine-6-phosphate deacetylase
LIVDGVHLGDAAVRLAVAARGWEGCLLVSDSIPAAGLPDGDYHLGPRSIRLEGGVARTPEGNLAGSTLGLDAAVPNTARAAGIAIEDAARMASTVPARVLGDESRGEINPGRRADLTVFDERGVRMTVVGGAIVHTR